MDTTQQGGQAMTTVDTKTGVPASSQSKAQARVTRRERGERVYFSRRRMEGIAALRIAFGVVWAVDAWFKWQPSFVGGFTDQRRVRALLRPSTPHDEEMRT
jgi:hypothetical protein